MSFEKHAAMLFQQIPEGMRHLVIIGGGALRAYWDRTVIKDIDCFFREEADYWQLIEDIAEGDSYSGWTLKSINSSRCHVMRNAHGVELNLIGFVFGTPDEHLSRFDFRCCQMVAWMNEHGQVCTNWDVEACTDAESHWLYIQNNNGTERTMRRIKHYLEDYGYTLHPDQTVEQEDAFEDAFNEAENDPRPQSIPESERINPAPVSPDVLTTSRRRLAALPVVQYIYEDK